MRVTCITTSKREDRKNFEGIMMENLENLMKTRNIHIQEAQ